MSEYLRIHPGTPQRRLIAAAAAIVPGGVIAYPTDSCYALGCRVGNREAMERIRRLRGLGAAHDFSLVCRDLSELATYAKVDNTAFRLLRAHTPGPYTFILSARRETPRVLHSRRRTIGLRVPDCPIVRALLEELGEPIMSSTLILAGDDRPIVDPQEIFERIGAAVDLVVDGGSCGIEPSSVVDLSVDPYRVIRHGKGDVSVFES